MKRTTTLSRDEARRIEEDLGRLSFGDGVSVGGLLGTALELEFCRRTKTWGPSTLLKGLVNVRRYRRGWNPSRGGSHEPPEKGTVVFGLSGKDSRFVGLLRPILEELQWSPRLVVGVPKNRIEVCENVAFVGIDGIGPEKRKGWRTEYKRLEPALKGVLGRLHREGRIDDFQYYYIWLHIIAQTQRAYILSEMFREAPPSAVVTDFDRSPLNAVLVAVARANGVPSLTLIHGSTSPPYCYLPFLADSIVGWGEDHMKQFRELGVNGNRLSIGGNPRWERTIRADREGVRREFGVGDKQRVWLLATTKTADKTLRDRLARKFCEFLRGRSDILGVIKPHPAETPEMYAEIKQDYPEIRVVDPHGLSVDESLALADVVCIHNSAFAVDALVKGVDVVVLDVIDKSLGVGETLVDEGVCFRVTGRESFQEAAEALSTDSADATAVRERRERFVLRYCRLYGRDAARVIVQIIRDTVGETVKTTAASTQRMTRVAIQE